MRLLDGRSWAVLPTLIINWAIFAQILSFQGLAIWVALASLLCWFVVSVLLHAHRRVLAWLFAVALPLACAGAAELIGGSTAGPITRASLTTCGLTTAGALIAHTRYARLVLVPMTLLLVCALALGAAGHAVAWVGAWVVAAGFTLVMLGPYGEHELLERERLRFLVVVLSVAGAVSVAVAGLASLIISQPWIVHPEGPIDEESSSPPPAIVPPAKADLLSALGTLTLKALLVLAFAVGVWLIIGIATRLFVVIGWRIALRGLRSGSSREQLLGAWTWTRLCLAQLEQPLPVHLSPDVASRWALKAGRAELAELAELAAPVAFDAQATPNEAEVARAWELADEIELLARHESLRARWRHSRRSVGRVRLELARQIVDLNQRPAGALA